MIKQRVLFRADGNSEIGLGHISRCCALADMLKDDFEIYFYTKVNITAIIEDIKNYCVDVFIMNDNITYDEEALQWVSALGENEIVVLDGYNFNTNYQQQIKAKGCKLVCIDDIHAYHFAADIVINHGPGIDKKNYSLENYTQLYLGTDYVLLKKIFLEEAVKQDKIFNITESPILICLGGADSNNITKQVLEETMHLFPQKKINVVVGAAYMYLRELTQTVEASQHISLFKNIDSAEMLLLMKQSHIAITSASTIALEYICVKGNLFLKQTADNQKDLYKSLLEKECSFSYELLKGNYDSCKNISNQYSFIDGKSDIRLLEIFSKVSHAW
jgi:UDP-2,4-diacetamido-2,4,6-trideoxy-beta-L-altropyranose hydrolase